MVVLTATMTVVRTVLSAGQFLTVGAQLMTVLVEVEKTVLVVSSMPKLDVGVLEWVVGAISIEVLLLSSSGQSSSFDLPRASLAVT